MAAYVHEIRIDSTASHTAQSGAKLSNGDGNAQSDYSDSLGSFKSGISTAANSATGIGEILTATTTPEHENMDLKPLGAENVPPLLGSEPEKVVTGTPAFLLKDSLPDSVEENDFTDPYSLPSQPAFESQEARSEYHIEPCHCGIPDCDKSVPVKVDRGEAKNTISEFSRYMNRLERRMKRLEAASTMHPRWPNDLSAAEDRIGQVEQVQDEQIHNESIEDPEPERLFEPKIFDQTEKLAFDALEDEKYVIKAVRAADSSSPDVSLADKVDSRFSNISINSTPLVHLLKSLVGESFDSSGCATRLKALSSPCAILHRRRSAILSQIEKLTAAFESGKEKIGKTERSLSTTKKFSPRSLANSKKVDQAQTDIPNDNEGSDDDSDFNPNIVSTVEDAHETAEALIHFRVLIKFLDDHFSQSLKKFEMLRSGKQKMVEFLDLWMLFDAEDIIYTPFRRGIKSEINGEYYGGKRVDTSQAYRVLGSVGGDPFVNPPTSSPPQGSKEAELDHAYRSSLLNPHNTAPYTLPDSNSLNTDVDHDKGKYKPFIIDCYRLGLDGVKFGSVPDKFMIPEFTGEIPIIELEVYPLINCPESNIRETLINRGLAFIDFSKISHMSYEGLTVGENREEVCKLQRMKLGFDR
jgi:hypothetical protein